MALVGNQTVVMACDGFGEDLKNAVAQYLKGKGVAVEDVGTDNFYSAAASVAQGVQKDAANVTGMLFCGTGMGVTIVANKFEGVYAALAENEDCARNSRAINNANVLCLGGKTTSEADALKIVDAFMEQKFAAAPGGYMQEFWSPDVEKFVKTTPAEIQSIERGARGAKVEQAAGTPTPCVVLGCDGFGEDLKNAVAQYLKEKGVAVVDVGTDNFYSAAASVAQDVQKDVANVTGMLFCGTGMGVSIVANKFEGVYAALAENEDCARNSRAINNANVLCLGGKTTSEADAMKIVDAFMEQKFAAAPGGYMQEFWSPDIEKFVKTTPAEIQKIEQQGCA